MYEAYATIVGNVISNPVKRETSTGEEVLSFRMASNVRRQNRTTGVWEDAETLYLTVACWRKLCVGVSASVMKGDPIIAYGQLRTNEWTSKEGVPRVDLEMQANAVGLDLARCQVRVDRKAAAEAKATESIVAAEPLAAEPDAEPPADRSELRRVLEAVG